MKQSSVSIIIDPRNAELTKYATHHLALRSGTNVAVGHNRMMYYIVTAMVFG